MSERAQREIPFLIHSRLEFDYDPDTGLVSVIALAGVERQGVPGNMRLRLSLLPETSQSLLADLPKLEALLVRAKKGPTKPDFYQ